MMEPLNHESENREPRPIIGRDTAVSVSLMLTILAAQFFVLNAFYDLKLELRRITYGMSQTWTQKDMLAWASELKSQNTSLLVPKVQTTEKE